MIIVVSSNLREASALALVAAKQPRSVVSCESLRQLRAKLRASSPVVLVSRIRLLDGYSDDVLALLTQVGLLPGTKVIVLANADCPPAEEARQLALGADCVLRDPLRPDVLSEYIEKFLKHPPERASQHLSSQRFTLAGVAVMPERQQMLKDSRAVHISPKEIALARLLAESDGKLLSYDLIYAELFQRAFFGDTANLRVLLAKLAASFGKLGVDLRAVVRLTPKTGCLYVPASEPQPPGAAAPIKKPRPKSRR